MFPQAQTNTTIISPKNIKKNEFSQKCQFEVLKKTPLIFMNRRQQYCLCTIEMNSRLRKWTRIVLGHGKL